MRQMQEAAQHQILLNLEGVSYMDSAGLTELVVCWKRAKERRGAVKLLSPSEKLWELLKTTRLTELFETFRNENEAILSFLTPNPVLIGGS